MTAAFHDDDAHQLYVDPESIASALDERARIRLSSIDQDQRFAFRAQTPATSLWQAGISPTRNAVVH